MLADFDKTDRRCTLCGERIDPSQEHIDHIREIAVGGNSDASNLRIVHAKCNKERPQSFECALCGMRVRWSVGGEHLNRHIIKPDSAALAHYRRYESLFLYGHVSNGHVRAMFVGQDGVHHPLDFEAFSPLVGNSIRESLQEDFKVITRWFDLVSRNDIVHPDQEACYRLSPRLNTTIRKEYNVLVADC
jgi:hypothetical protein